jgi:predicted dehydrogenase
VKTAIIGTGLQALRRGLVFEESNDEITLLAGINPATTRSLAKRLGTEFTDNPMEVFEDKSIEAVIICTPPESHAKYIAHAVEANKKVLVEKPMLSKASEAIELLENYQDKLSELVRCGFNHRFHPGLLKLKEVIDSGALGSILFIRTTYGIGARSSYQNEWRANPELAAGGQFIEQGSHQIDLIRWLGGQIHSVYAATTNKIFADAALDDGGMAIFRLDEGATASMHTTLGQWHNQFLFEYFGSEGFAKVQGLGGSYGQENIEVGFREENAPFSSKRIQFRGGDISWKLEWQAFKDSFNSNDSQIGTFSDGLETMRIAEAAYLSSSSRAEVLVNGQG